MELITFHASLDQGDSLFLCVRDEHQVISKEELPRYTSAEVKQECLQYQNEEQWVKDRTLMHTSSHAKLLPRLTIDLHRTLGIALDVTHNLFLNPDAP